MYVHVYAKNVKFKFKFLSRFFRSFRFSFVVRKSNNSYRLQCVHLNFYFKLIGPTLVALISFCGNSLYKRDSRVSPFINLGGRHEPIMI